MRGYKNKVDAAFGVLLVIGSLLGLLLLLAAFYVTVFWKNPQYAGLIVPFVLMLVVFILGRVQLLRRGVRWWAYLSMLLMSCWAAAAFGALPLHDIFVVYFGSHGRFGCEELIEVAPEVYRHAYLFRDQTAPFILFGPLFLGVLCHWICVPRAREVLFREHLFARRVKVANAGPYSGPCNPAGSSGAAEGPPSTT
jgi:hypothetical protein